MTPAKKHSSVLLISLSVLCCALAVWLLYGRTCANAQTIKTTKNTTISVKATGLGPARSVPLYGFNAENRQGPVWSTPRLLKQIKSLQLQIIRYPGGAISDWWDWKSGWLVKNSNLPSNLKKLPYLNLDINELKKVVDATGCQVVFTLNMISASLNDQISMLQHAQQIGIPVKWIELGNEVNLKNSAGMQKFKGAQLYASTSKKWITTIRQYFPSVKIAVVGGDNVSKRNQMIETRWNDLVLSKISTVNAIVLHDYPQPIKIIDQSGINFQKLHQQFIEIYNKKGFNTMPPNQDIWLTEYNIHWAYTKGFDDKKAIQKYATTWSQGLAIVLLTSTATNISPKITLFTNHNLTGWTPFAAIETTNKTFNLLPNGIGMQAWLAAVHGMRTMAKIKFTNSQNKAIPDFQLFGWKFNNGATQKAILVNLTNNNMTVDLKAASLPQTISYHTLYTSKNQQINSLSNVQKKTGTTRQGKLSLPPYSIANLGETIN